MNKIRCYHKQIAPDFLILKRMSRDCCFFFLWLFLRRLFVETYIPSEKLAIESGSADENLEIMKAYMCKQRGIRLIKLPMKGTELDYANNLKKAFQSVHIFISSDTEEDVEIIKNTFERWRDSQ